MQTFDEIWNLPEHVETRKNNIQLLADTKRELNELERWVISLAASNIKNGKGETINEGLKHATNKRGLKGIVLENIYLDYEDFIPVDAELWQKSNSPLTLEEWSTANAITQIADSLYKENIGVGMSIKEKGTAQIFLKNGLEVHRY